MMGREMKHETVTGAAAAPARFEPGAGNPARPGYLAIDQLWKTFGDFVALKGVSLEIKEGEFVCFLGPSGCGKTTLLRAVAGIVFQSYALFPNLTIEKNIAFGLENARRPKAEIQARVKELLALVGLSEQAKKYPAQLSGGQQQRIALARAMAVSPGLLLLDEPLSALDAKVRVHLRHEIKELQRKLGVTTIMVTHDQEEALSMADRIVVMNHGVIEQVGTPTEVYRHPSTLFVADFIGETNQFAARALGNDRLALAGTELVCAPHICAAGAFARSARPDRNAGQSGRGHGRGNGVPRQFLALPAGLATSRRKAPDRRLLAQCCPPAAHRDKRTSAGRTAAEPCACLPEGSLR